MSAETQFWNNIELLRGHISRTERKTLMSVSEYETLFSTIHNIFGDWQAGSFVKMCACLKNGEIAMVAEGLLDLKKHHWICKNILAEKNRVYENASQGHFYHDSEFNRRSFVRRRLVVLDKYDEDNIEDMDEARHAFVSARSIFLNLRQKNMLPREASSPAAKKGAPKRAFAWH
jgi:hypothetical protein